METTQEFKKGSWVYFYVKRHKTWMIGQITREREFSKDLECYTYLLKDDGDYNWEVEDSLITNTLKKGTRIFSSRLMKYIKL